jgi:hypothetical protein
MGGQQTAQKNILERLLRYTPEGEEEEIKILFRLDGLKAALRALHLTRDSDDLATRYGATLIRECAEAVNEPITEDEADEGARAIMSLYHLPRNVRRQMLTRAREVILLDPQNWDDPRE